VILHFNQRSEARAGSLNPLILSGKDSGARSVFFSGGDEGVDGGGEGAREGARRGTETVESSKQRRRQDGTYTGDGGVAVDGVKETEGAAGVGEGARTASRRHGGTYACDGGVDGAGETGEELRRGVSSVVGITTGELVAEGAAGADEDGEQIATRRHGGT
jgi:hypothetical protein